MVFFTCNECGTAVKKNQVEKHCFQCRNCKSVSCIDCNKEFWGDDYKTHIKCVTEDQRYGGKNYQPKASSNKNEIKQEKWIEHIKTTLSTKNITGPLLDLMERVITYTNIPRKQSKFKNFLQNSLRVRNEKLISSAWDIFASSTKNKKRQTQKVEAGNTSLLTEQSFFESQGPSASSPAFFSETETPQLAKKRKLEQVSREGFAFGALQDTILRENPHQHFGDMVAIELDSIKPNVIPIVKRMIFDVIYRAQMGEFDIPEAKASVGMQTDAYRKDDVINEGQMCEFGIPEANASVGMQTDAYRKDDVINEAQICEFDIPEAKTSMGMETDEEVLCVFDGPMLRPSQSVSPIALVTLD